MDAITFDPIVTVSTLTITSANISTIHTGTGTWTVQNSLIHRAGILNIQGSSITVGGNMEFTSGATLSLGTATVLLNGASTQNIWLSSKTFNTIDVQNVSAGGVRFRDGLTVSTFTALVAGTTMQFATGTSSITVTRYLGLGPASGTKLGLRSVTDASQWGLVLATGATQSVQNVDVKDSNANGGLSIIALDWTSTNSGNNLNWLFPVCGAMTSNGTGGGNWSAYGSWLPYQTPSTCSTITVLAETR